jgi:2',3'-cyclic-nucleotide 2'-phosphodiesterase (5'-nucleotidase family)
MLPTGVASAVGETDTAALGTNEQVAMESADMATVSPLRTQASLEPIAAPVMTPGATSASSSEQLLGAERTYNVTNSGQSYYNLDGDKQPSITLVRGNTYTFNVDASSHPFHISTDSNGGDFSGIYTDGVNVTNPSSANDNATETGTLTFTVPSDAPDTLYYQCGVHSGMGASITVVDPGNVSIVEIQSNTTDGDASAYAGMLVNTTGTVTATNDDGFFLQDTAATAGYSGIYVYGSSGDVSPGDVVQIEAPVEEYFGLTQLNASASNASLSTTGTGSVPAAVSVDTEEVSQERYESVLVNVSDLTVTSTPNQYGEWDVTDGSGAVAVDNVATGDDATPAQTGATIDAIEGPVYFSFDEFKIQPSSVENLTAPASDDGGAVGENATTITLLGFNDIGKAAAGAGDDKLGRMITLINNRRTSADNPVFVAGGGDELSPHALRNYDGLEAGYEPPVEAMNLIDPDAEVVQNHELDYDEDAGTNDFAVFQTIADESTYPWLLANVVEEDTGDNLPGTKNYTVVERDGVKVGFFGLTDEAINAKTDGVIERNGYKVLDPSSTAERTVDTLRNEENVDVVVALAPLGIPDSKSLAQDVEGIDAIISGDDQQRYMPQKTNGVLIGETSGRANAVISMNLTVDNGSVVQSSGTLVDVTTDVPRNKSWKEYINPLREEYLNTNLTQAEMPEHTGVGSAYTDDTSTGLLLTDGVRNYTGANVAITNAGGIRDTLYPSSVSTGETFNITRGMVTSTLSFGNSIVVVEVTGAELRAVVRSQLTPLESDSQYGTQAQQQVSGMTFEWVPHTSVSSPGEGDAAVQDLTVNGEPVGDNETYTLATNSYIAEGGSGFPLEDKPRVKVYNTTMANGVIAYLQNRTLVEDNETDTEERDRMRRVDTTLNASSVTQSTANDETTFTVDVPDRVTGVTGHATLMNARGDHYGTSDVAYDSASETVTVTVSNSDLDYFGTEPLTPTSDLDLYVDYVDSEYDSQYENFDSSVLNVDLETESAQPADGIALGVGDARDQLGLGEKRTFEVTASEVPDGVGAYELRISVGDTGVGRITDIEAAGTPGFADSSISEDNRSATVDVADASGADDSTQTLAIVTVEGVSYGKSTTLELTPVAGPFDPDGNAYTVSRIDNRVVTVEAGDVTGNGQPMADRDGDGDFEDVNGDGSVDVVDVQALFANRETQPVKSSTSAFDLNGDGSVDVGDVQRLFADTNA